MLRLSGRLADGTITWMGGLDYLRDVAIPTMSEAAEKAGRPAPRFIAMVPVLLTDDRDAGRDTINQTFEMYGRDPVVPSHARARWREPSRRCRRLR